MAAFDPFLPLAARFKFDPLAMGCSFKKVGRGHAKVRPPRVETPEASYRRPKRLGRSLLRRRRSARRQTLPAADRRDPSEVVQKSRVHWIDDFADSTAPFPALSSSSFEKLKSGFIRASWLLRPSTIFARPMLSAQYIGPPR